MAIHKNDDDDWGQGVWSVRRKTSFLNLGQSDVYEAPKIPGDKWVK